MRKATVIFLVMLIGCQTSLTDWSKNYSITRDTAFGTKLVYKHLGDLFPNNKINSYKTRLYQPWMNAVKSINLIGDLLMNSKVKASTKSESIKDIGNIVLHGEMYLDEHDRFALLLLASQGSTILLAPTEYSPEIKALFNLGLQSIAVDTFSVSVNGDQIHLDDMERLNVFNEQGKTSMLFTSSLGLVATELKLGKGKIIFCSSPQLLTNYVLTCGGHKFCEAIFSEFDDDDLNWYANYSSFDFLSSEINSPSYLTYIKKNKALALAFGLLFISALLFALFGVKRNQRLIPVIEQPTNNSVKQNNHIALLYEGEKDYSGAAKKLILFFTEYLKQRYHIKDDFDIEQKFDLSAEKQAKLRQVLLLDKKHIDAENISKKDLMKLEENINDLKTVL